MTTHEKDQLKVIARILETFVPQTEFVVETGDDGEVGRYSDSLYTKLLAGQFGKIFRAFAFGVNCLLTRTQSYKLQASCLRLLLRAYYMITEPAVRSHIEQTLITVLETFAQFQDIKNHRIAAIALYHLVHSEASRGEFR